MTALRATAWGLLVVLLVGPLIAFAAGDAALDLWNKPARHGQRSQVDLHHLGSKTTPGATAATPRPFPGAPLGWIAVTDTSSAPSVVSRPPFVPPRV